MEEDNKKKNIQLYLLLLVATVLIAVGIVGTIRNRESGEEKAETSITQEPLDESVEEVPVVVEAEQTAEKEIPSNLNNPEQLIEYYQSQLEQEPNGADTPAYLNALANIYKTRKQDCASAIPYYERIMIDFPQWEGIKSVYPELADCYEQVDDYKGKIWVHEEAMRIFPPDSQEYLYAKTALGLERIEESSSPPENSE